MSDKGIQNRTRIVEAAAHLFYHRGFNQTSFAEVAEASGIPKGNFYYYFKAKDELLSAVIDMRLEGIKQRLLQFEEQEQEPLARLHCIAIMLGNEADNILQHGCPVGSLNVELGKTQEVLQQHAANMFNLFIDWCEREFHALGKGDDSRFLSMHLMAMLQGAALLSHVYNDRAYLEREVLAMRSWLDSL